MLVNCGPVEGSPAHASINLADRFAGGAARSKNQYFHPLLSRRNTGGGYFYLKDPVSVNYDLEPLPEKSGRAAAHDHAGQEDFKILHHRADLRFHRKFKGDGSTR
jgi:hypothetical protein